MCGPSSPLVFPSKASIASKRAYGCCGCCSEIDHALEFLRKAREKARRALMRGAGCCCGRKEEGVERRDSL